MTESKKICFISGGDKKEIDVYKWPGRKKEKTKEKQTTTNPQKPQCLILLAVFAVQPSERE